MGMLDAATVLDGALPELFCGFDRSEYPAPLPYPTSCSPQAWAAATPVQLMRALLGIDPWIPRREIWFSPAWPESYGAIRIHNLAVGNSRVTLSVDSDGSAGLSGLTDRIEVIHSRRGPASEMEVGDGI
jgi:glycogen debranching enzyme